MKQVYVELALQAGGSHYPDVGGQTLERFAELLVERCIEICNKGEETQTTCTGAAQAIRQYFQ